MKFLPQRLPISSFGNGGFRFGEYSHQGSLLILPSGMRAWDGAELEDFLAERSDIDFVLIGTGKTLKRMPAASIARLENEGLNVDQMSTSAAIHNYNVMLAEERRVAAALMAVE